MKNEAFIYFCKCLYQVYGIPVRIYNEEKLILKYELVSLHAYLEPLIDDHLFREIAPKTKNYYVYRTPNSYTYGFIRNKNSKLSVLIGPSPSATLNKQEFYENMRHMSSYSLPDHIYKTLEFYINTIPIMQTGRFIYILCSIYAAVYNEILTPENIKIEKPSEIFDAKIHRDTVQHFEEISYGDIEKTNYYDYEKRLLLLIRNGMTDLLIKIWQEGTVPANMESSESGTLRAMKNSCIIAIGIVSNTVLEVGCEQEDIYHLRQSYVEQTEKCLTVKEVLNLRFNMMIDFCRHVEHQKYKASNVPIVNHAIKFVNDNIDKKISLQEIASAVHASKSYLCAEFSKAMGVGIFRYIQEQKVKRAKQLLMLSDKTLSEISELLSFSSQSYFQKIFKEIAGMTPKEFRDQNMVK